MEELITKQSQNTEITSENTFPNSGYIMDATKQQFSQPSFDCKPAARYFSGKHRMYCLKSQVIVTLKGLAVHVVSGIEGDFHDKMIFDQNIDNFIVKVIDSHPNRLSEIIGDKGYQELSLSLLKTLLVRNTGDHMADMNFPKHTSPW